MAFCEKCGTQLSDGVKFCPGCGSAIAQEQQPVQETAQQPQQQTEPNPGAQTQNTQTQADASQAADKINETISKIMDTADTSAEYDAADIENNKLVSILSYIGLLFLVPLFVAKESKFARFHVNQGIVLFAVSFIYGIVLFAANFIYGIVSAILGVIFGLIPVIGAIVGIILSVFALVPLILMILGIYNAATGRAKELPLIGQIRIIK